MTAQKGLLVAVLVLVAVSCRPGSTAAGDGDSARGDPVAVWHMDELSGPTMRDAVGDHDGSIRNVGLGRAGRKGKAYSFDGSSSGVQVSDSESLDPGPGDFGVTVHLRVSRPPGIDSYDVIRKGISTGQYWKLEIHPNGRPHCVFAGSKGTVAIGGREARAGTPSVSDGRWHEVTCEKLADKVVLTIDGRSFSREGSVGSVKSTHPLTMGFRSASNPDDYFAGELDEVRIVKS